MNRLQYSEKKQMQNRCANILRDGAVARAVSRLRNHGYMAMPKGVRPFPFATSTTTGIWDLAVQGTSTATGSKCYTEGCPAVSLCDVQKENANRISAHPC